MPTTSETIENDLARLLEKKDQDGIFSNDEKLIIQKWYDLTKMRRDLKEFYNE